MIAITLWAKQEQTIQAIDDYQAAGLIFCRPYSCRPSILGRMYVGKRLHEQTGIPVWFLVTDMVDSRERFETQTKREIEAFIETVDAYKAKKKAQP